MGSDTFESCAEGVLRRLLAGVSIADAARQEGVAARTVSRWLARGRVDPDGPYGTFTARVDAAGRVRALPSATSREHMDADELLGLLEDAARAGNVTAMKTLLDRFKAEPAPPVDVFDELKTKRASRVV